MRTTVMMCRLMLGAVLAATVVLTTQPVLAELGGDTVVPTDQKSLNFTHPGEAQGFNPQPEPPGDNMGDGSVIPTDQKGLNFTHPGEAQGFNPQPEPPGDKMGSGKASMQDLHLTHPGEAQGFNPQPDPPGQPDAGVEGGAPTGLNPGGITDGTHLPSSVGGGRGAGKVQMQDLHFTSPGAAAPGSGGPGGGPRLRGMPVVKPGVGSGLGTGKVQMQDFHFSKPGAAQGLQPKPMLPNNLNFTSPSLSKTVTPNLNPNPANQVKPTTSTRMLLPAVQKKNSAPAGMPAAAPMIRPTR